MTLGDKVDDSERTAAMLVERVDTVLKSLEIVFCA